MVKLGVIKEHFTLTKNYFPQKKKGSTKIINSCKNAVSIAALQRYYKIALKKKLYLFKILSKQIKKINKFCKTKKKILKKLLNEKLSFFFLKSSKCKVLKNKNM